MEERETTREFDIGRSLNLTRVIEDEGGRGCIWKGGERESYSLSDSIEHNSWFDVFARLTIVIFEVSCLLEREKERERGWTDFKYIDVLG